MATGHRLPEAEYRGRRVSRDELEDHENKWAFDRRQLICGGEGCTADVSAVIPHKREGNRVEGHFRLGSDQQHSSECKYNVAHRVRVLAAEYQDAGGMLEGVYRLELREPVNVLEAEAESSGEPGRSGSTGVEYHPSGETIPRTLQAAKQIQRLIHEFMDDPEVAARFRGVYRGDEYGWSEFFFEAAHDARRLAASISGNQHHPRVVRGTVRFRDTDRKGTGVALVLDSDLQAKWPRSKQGVKVVLRTNDPSHLPYEPGDVVIAYGLWGKFSPGGAKDEAQLWVHEPRNVTPDEPRQ